MPVNSELESKGAIGTGATDPGSGAGKIDKVKEIFLIMSILRMHSVPTVPRVDNEE